MSRVLVTAAVLAVASALACGGGSADALPPGSVSEGDGPSAGGSSSGGSDPGDGGASVVRDAASDDAGRAACNPTGFAAAATPFPLPSGFSALYGVVSNGYCDSRNVPRHSVMDVDGDGKLDLLVTSSCTDPAVDVSKWLLYRGTGSGFSNTHSDFALPSGYSSFNGEASAGYCDSRNVPRHSMMDVDGDGKLDLLVTSSCTDPEVDVSRWLLYRGTGSGFSKTPSNFALPPGYSSFAGAASNGYCDLRNIPRHSVSDVDGDGKVDLLVTSSCTDETIDVSRWLLFRGDGSGFAKTPSDFVLPPGYSQLGGEASAAYCDGRNIPRHNLMDVDGDGRIDLLVTSSCSDATVDVSRWLLFRGNGSGFAKAPSDFALPPGYSGFYGVFSKAYCDSRNVPAHSVLDVDGDGKLDLLVTSSCSDVSVDVSKWLLYRGDGSGFTKNASDFALPPGFSALYGLASSAYCDGRNVPRHNVMDVDGDGAVDLLVTSSCSDGAVDVSKWLLFAGTCKP